MRKATLIFLVCCLLLVVRAGAQFAIFQVSNSQSIPTADVVCTITTGNCVGTGGGSGVFTAATCDGNPAHDDAAAFVSFNTWAVSTWQASHTGLIELDTPANTCYFIANAGGNNSFTKGIKNFQLVGYGTTLSDNGGAGAGVNLGAIGIVNDNAHSVTFATISAGATSVTISNTSLCSLFSANDWTLLGGLNTIDQSGYPPTFGRYEYIQINSVASCAGSGVITFKTATRYGYKSTWPAYWLASGEASFGNGPGQIFALDQAWVTTQAFYGITIDQGNTHINANGQHISFYDVSTPNGNGFGPIPSQNQTWSVTRGNFPDVHSEFDKVVENVTLTNVTVHSIQIQSGNNPQNFTCNTCTITSSLNGITGNTTLNGGTIADMQLGSTSFGANTGAFVGNSATINGFSFGGAQGGSDKIQARGKWASGTITIPPSTSVSAAADDGTGKIKLTVTSSAGYVIGIGFDGPGGACTGFMTVTSVPDSTHIVTDANFTATCSGSIGNMPLALMVPGGYFYLNGGNGATPVGPIFQIADLSLDVNNSIVVSLNQGGSPYAGGFPTVPGTTWTAVSYPSPSWSCVGCTGAMNVVDLSSPSASGLPIGSYASRTVTAANNTASGNTAMISFGALTEMDITVNPACSGASNFDMQGPFYSILGSSSAPTNWVFTINANQGSATPRKIFPTTQSGAQSGDTLTTPGSGAWLSLGQQVPKYATPANCSSASTVITIQTNQGL